MKIIFLAHSKLRELAFEVILSGLYYIRGKRHRQRLICYVRFISEYIIRKMMRRTDEEIKGIMKIRWLFILNYSRV